MCGKDEALWGINGEMNTGMVLLRSTEGAMVFCRRWQARMQQEMLKVAKLSSAMVQWWTNDQVCVGSLPSLPPPHPTPALACSHAHATPRNTTLLPDQTFFNEVVHSAPTLHAANLKSAKPDTREYAAHLYNAPHAQASRTVHRRSARRGRCPKGTALCPLYSVHDAAALRCPCCAARAAPPALRHPRCATRAAGMTAIHPISSHLSRYGARMLRDAAPSPARLKQLESALQQVKRAYSEGNIATARMLATMRGLAFKRVGCATNAGENVCLEANKREQTVTITTFPYLHFASGHTYFTQSLQVLNCSRGFNHSNPPLASSHYPLPLLTLNPSIHHLVLATFRLTLLSHHLATLPHRIPRLCNHHLVTTPHHHRTGWASHPSPCTQPFSLETRPSLPGASATGCARSSSGSSMTTPTTRGEGQGRTPTR